MTAGIVLLNRRAAQHPLDGLGPGLYQSTDDRGGNSAPAQALTDRACMTKPSHRPVRVGLISLGCAKNLVDAEIMLGSLLKSGIEITNGCGAGGCHHCQHLFVH